VRAGFETEGLRLRTLVTLTSLAFTTVRVDLRPAPAARERFAPTS
jgi:hypothetical protein